jgi:hypothetical protein
MASFSTSQAWDNVNVNAGHDFNFNFSVNGSGDITERGMDHPTMWYPRRLMTVRHAERHREIMELADWISPLNFNPLQESAFSKYTVGTAQKILDSGAYNAWLEGRKSRMIWARGDRKFALLSSMVIMPLTPWFQPASERPSWRK